MINMLKDRLPLTVMVGGISYNVDYYHDTALTLMSLLSDELWTPQERAEKALEIFYGDIIPDNHNEAFYRLLCFLNGVSEIEQEEGGGKNDKIIDFDVDGNVIYTAFLRVYNIDLQDHPIHWWQFKVMLEDLGDTPALNSIIKIRSTDEADVPDKQRGSFRRLKKRYALEGAQKPAETLEERNRRWREG